MNLLLGLNDNELTIDVFLPLFNTFNSSTSLSENSLGNLNLLNIIPLVDIEAIVFPSDPN